MATEKKAEDQKAAWIKARGKQIKRFHPEMKIEDCEKAAEEQLNHKSNKGLLLKLEADAESK